MLDHFLETSCAKVKTPYKFNIYPFKQNTNPFPRLMHMFSDTKYKKLTEKINFFIEKNSNYIFFNYIISFLLNTVQSPL